MKTLNFNQEQGFWQQIDDEVDFKGLKLPIEDLFSDYEFSSNQKKGIKDLTVLKQ